MLFFIGTCFFPMYCSASELNSYNEVGENKKVDINCDTNDLEYITDPFFIYGSIRNLTIKYLLELCFGVILNLMPEKNGFLMRRLDYVLIMV